MSSASSTESSESGSRSASGSLSSSPLLLVELDEDESEVAEVEGPEDSELGLLAVELAEAELVEESSELSFEELLELSSEELLDVDDPEELESEDVEDPSDPLEDACGLGLGLPLGLRLLFRFGGAALFGRIPSGSWAGGALGLGTFNGVMLLPRGKISTLCSGIFPRTSLTPGYSDILPP